MISVGAPLKKVLFLSDLDGTWLSKSPQCRQDLDRGVLALKDEYLKQGIDLEFGYVTARPPERVAPEHLPTPDWTISDNGGFIHRGDPVHTASDGTVSVAPEMPEWQALNEKSGFSADKAVATARRLLGQPAFRRLHMRTVGKVVGFPEADACPWLAALCFDDSSIRLTPGEAVDANRNGVPDCFENATFQAPSELERFQAGLKKSLDAQGISSQISPVYPFSGKPIAMFDVTAPLADKGDAIEFLMHHEGITPDHVIVAGDGGNDITMMRARDGSDDGRRAIVVGGLQQLYDAAAKLQHAILQPADMDCSEAVLDGLKKQLALIAAENRGQSTK